MRDSETKERLSRWQNWLVYADALADEVLRRRGGEPIPVDELIAEDSRCFPDLVDR